MNTNIKSRIERLERHQGPDTEIPITSGCDRWGPTDTIEQWQAACLLINAEYAIEKEQNKALYDLLRVKPSFIK